MCQAEKDAPLEFRGKDKRGCTDVLMLLLFIGSWVAALVILGEAVRFGGSPYRVIYGVDFQGNICGKTSGFGDRKYAAWPIPPTDTTKFSIKICVANCNATKIDNQSFLPNYESWPFYRYCLPKSIDVTDEFTSSAETTSRIISDLFITWPVIFGAVFVAVIFSFIYVRCMRISCCRKIIVWGVFLALVVGGFFLGWSLLKYAQEAKTSTVEVKNRVLAAQVTGWIVIALTVVFMLVVFFLRARINIALAVTGAAAAALGQMKQLILFPILPFFMLVAFAVYWIITALYLFSVKTSQVKSLPSEYQLIPYFNNNNFTTYISYDWETRFQKLFAYHFFHFLWCLQFLIYLTFMTIAGAIANWYFSKPTPTNDEVREEGDQPGQLSTSPVCGAFYRVIRFHLGTVAFGALLIAVIQFIRAVLYYIERKTKNRENCALRCTFCVIQCCLRCFQKCIDYVSRNALAWSAIRGDNFCYSACASVGLILSNAGRAAAMNLVGNFILLFGKICISLVTTGIAGLIIMYSYHDDISSTIMPLVIIFILSFAVATLFMELFETALDTMFLCVMADKNGDFAPKALRDALDLAEGQAKKEQDAVAKKNGADPAANKGIEVADVKYTNDKVAEK